MIRFGPSVDDARTTEDVEFIDPWTIAAVPVPVLFKAAQGAMASGAWAEARDLLTAAVGLEPGFEQDGQRARELLAEATRAHARATRRKRIISPWPVLFSAGVLVLVPVAAGLATAAFGSNAAVSGPPVFEAVPAISVTEPTVMPTLSIVVLPVPTVEPATPAQPPALPIVVAPLSTAAPAAPTLEATREEVVIREPPAKQNVTR